jgi:hypothetical protein
VLARARGERARTSGELQGITRGGSFGAAFTRALCAHACGHRRCLNRILCSPDSELGVYSPRDESSPGGAGAAASAHRHGSTAATGKRENGTGRLKGT